MNETDAVDRARFEWVESFPRHRTLYIQQFNRFNYIQLQQFDRPNRAVALVYRIGKSSENLCAIADFANNFPI